MKPKRDRLEIFHDMLKAISDRNGKIKPNLEVSILRFLRVKTLTVRVYSFKG